MCVEKENTKVVITIDSYSGSFNNKQLDEFIKAIKDVKVYGGRR